MIASSRRDNECTIIDPEAKMCCGKKELMCCSEINCQVQICKKCYDSHDKNTVTYLDQHFYHIMRVNIIDEDDVEDEEIEDEQEDDIQEEVEFNEEVEEEEKHDDNLQSNDELFGW